MKTIINWLLRKHKPIKAGKTPEQLRIEREFNDGFLVDMIGMDCSDKD